MENVSNHQSSEPNDVLGNYESAIQLAEEVVKEENWRSNIEHWLVLGLEYGDVAGLTKNQRKKLRNKVNRVLRKPGLRNINALLWFVSRVILGDNKPAWNVKISEKEETIQERKREWKKAETIAWYKLQEYKYEKGDFYKEQTKIRKERKRKELRYEM